MGGLIPYDVLRTSVNKRVKNCKKWNENAVFPKLPSVYRFSWCCMPEVLADPILALANWFLANAFSDEQYFMIMKSCTSCYLLF